MLSATAARVLQNLAADEVAETRERLLQEKRSELEHYIQIALGSVKGLYDGAAQGDMARREQAIAILSKIKYGADGYVTEVTLTGSAQESSRSASPATSHAEATAQCGERCVLRGLMI